MINSTIEAEIFKTTIMLGDKNLAQINKLLSIWGMTSLQYSALWVIYHSSKHNSKDRGLSSKEIGSELYTRVPDVTRLLDRMVDKGWVTRKRDPENRRIVRTCVTQIGKELVESAHAPLLELESKQLGHLTTNEKSELSRLLNKALS